MDYSGAFQIVDLPTFGSLSAFCNCPSVLYLPFYERFCFAKYSTCFVESVLNRIKIAFSHTDLEAFRSGAGRVLARKGRQKPVKSSFE